MHNPHNRSVYDPDSSVSVAAENNGVSMGQFTTASSGNDLDFLNINQTITCLAAGPISTSTHAMNAPESKSNSAASSVSTRVGAGAGGVVRRKSTLRQKNQLNNDVLVVGTKTSIHVYDILHNSDLYYKEVSFYDYNVQHSFSKDTYRKINDYFFQRFLMEQTPWQSDSLEKYPMAIWP